MSRGCPWTCASRRILAVGDMDGIRTDEQQGPVVVISRVRDLSFGRLTYNAGVVQQPLDLGFAKVRDTNSSGLAGLETLFHGLVCVNVVRISLLDVTVRVLLHQLVASCKGRWPMHKVQVNVVGVKILEGSIECFLYIIRVVRVVPKLGDQENIAAWNSGLLDRRTHSRLGSVDTRSIDVSVSSIESVGDSLLLSVLVLPGSETDRRNAGSVKCQSSPLYGSMLVVVDPTLCSACALCLDAPF